MITKIQKWGNSQGLRFPKSLLEEIQMQVGDEVELTIHEGHIVVKPVHKIRGRYTLEELLANVVAHDEESEVDWGEPEGKEAW